MSNWIKNLWTKIISSDNQPLNNKIKLLQLQLEVAKNNLNIQVDENIVLQYNIELLNKQIKNIEGSIDSAKLEYYWNNKIKPATNVTHPARNGNHMNVIRFLNEKNGLTPTVDGDTNDFKANNALKYVRHFMTYTSDAKENWQWADESVRRKLGDCEDGAILMANIMLKSGVPYWRIRLNAGDVKGGGHAYVTYLREADNQWYILDWCYWYTESVNFKRTWAEAKNYFGIWFSWNQKYAFLKDELDR